MLERQILIENAFENRHTITPQETVPHLKAAIDSVMADLNSGKIRVAEKNQGQWIVHTWIKKAILLFFRITPTQTFENPLMPYFDKVPLKYTDYTTADFMRDGIRVVPQACVRYGSFIDKNTVLMPSYVNLGAYIGEGSMIDTWATVGSCAQIGKHVHLSGGVGIGGVLEPLQAHPTIIEDNCFIGARSEIVEGVIVEENSVISMGVYIGQSTKIYNRLTGEITYGRVPAGSVVVSGNLPDKDGRCSLYAAIIVKQVDAKTRAKVSLNELLRDE
jgi:2,3,4,5-tetrahydropyridine-2,6-dicarboxylate N-succinyltransferase